MLNLTARAKPELTEAEKRSKRRPHSFAVNPPRGFVGSCNPLDVTKYYAHVYQTKVEVKSNDRRTLQSKRMARDLKRLFGDQYNPRPGDIGERVRILKHKREMNGPMIISGFQWLNSLI